MIGLLRRILAHYYKVPFKTEIWYNRQAHCSKESLEKSLYIDIYDKGEYINCPQIGGVVECVEHGRRFYYKVVGFNNWNPNGDWLFDSDYITPIIKFYKPVK